MSVLRRLWHVFLEGFRQGRQAKLDDAARRKAGIE